MKEANWTIHHSATLNVRISYLRGVQLGHMLLTIICGVEPHNQFLN